MLIRFPIQLPPAGKSGVVDGAGKGGKSTSPMVRDGAGSEPWLVVGGGGSR